MNSASDTASLGTDPSRSILAEQSNVASSTRAVAHSSGMKHSGQAASGSHDENHQYSSRIGRRDGDDDDDDEDKQSITSTDIDAMLDSDSDIDDDYYNSNYNSNNIDEGERSWRAKRLAELKRMGEDAAMRRSQTTFGTYDVLHSEKEVLALTTTLPFVVVHFAHKDYRTCQIMDRHLEALARRYPLTRFAKVFVEDAPFLVEKMHIRVLPCVIVFVDAFSKYRLLGFDEVGGHDQVSTQRIEDWFKTKEVLENPYNRSAKDIKKSKQDNEEDIDH